MTALQPQRQHPLAFYGSTKLLERERERDFWPYLYDIFEHLGPFDQS